MNEYLDALDEALQINGEDVILRRMISGNPVEVTCRANVRSYRQRDEMFVAGSEIAQPELLVIMTPTQIIAAGWPAGGTGVNPSFPRKGDYVLIQGRQRAIEVVDNIHVDDVWVRIEIRLLG